MPYAPHSFDISSGLAAGISDAGKSIGEAIDYHNQQAKLNKTTQDMFLAMHPDKKKEDIQDRTMQSLQGQMIGEAQLQQKQQVAQQMQEQALKIAQAKQHQDFMGKLATMMGGGGAPAGAAADGSPPPMSMPPMTAGSGAGDPMAMMAGATGAAPPGGSGGGGGAGIDMSDPASLIKGVLAAGGQPQDVQEVMAAFNKGYGGSYLDAKANAINSPPEEMDLGDGRKLVYQPGGRTAPKIIGSAAPALPAVGSTIPMKDANGNPTGDMLVHTGAGKYEPYNAKTGFGNRGTPAASSNIDPRIGALIKQGIGTTKENPMPYNPGATKDSLVPGIWYKSGSGNVGLFDGEKMQQTQ